jgi:hypothetical protein
MNLKIAFLFLFGVVANSIYAQQSVVAAGGNASGTTGSFSYSVGQVAYTTISTANGSLTQGVQQPFEILTLSGEEITHISLSMTVFPNPTTSIVTLKIEDMELENINYQLFDVNGRQIDDHKVTENESTIDLESNAIGIYLLHVMENNTLIKSFKIIKN